MLSVADLSLSPNLSVTSVLFPVSPFPRDGSLPSRTGRPCRDTRGASTPVDDLGLADVGVARDVGGRQAGGVADCAVDVGNRTARPADDVMVVVLDARLVASHGARRLEAPHQTSGGHGQQHRLDRLDGYLAEHLPHPG